MDGRFRGVVEAVLGVDGQGITDTDSARTIPQWDSVTHLQLLMALESEFGVQFSPDDMATLSTIGSLRERLEDLGAA